MRPEDRDILFGDRFGAWDDQWGGEGAGPWPMPGVDVDALMDAYFDGDISDDDRVRLFELLRRDPDRCLQFVEMQRTALLLERAPAGPDQTESILNSLGRYQVSQGSRAGWHRYRIGPRAMRGAIAAAVMLAGAGLVMLGKWEPLRGGPRLASQPGDFEQAPKVASDSAMVEAPASAEAATMAIASNAPLPARRPALRPGELRSLDASLARDGQVDAPTRGLAGIAPGPGQQFGRPPALVMDPGLPLDQGVSEFEGFGGFSPVSPRDVRRLMGFTYGGYTPWGMYGGWGDSSQDRWEPPALPPRQPARPVRD